MNKYAYCYSNKSLQARERLRALEEMEDGFTRDSLNALGILRGWRCLEVGAGAGSVAYWLKEQVGDEGCVVATDIDTELLDPARCTIWKHNIRTDELPHESFDLIHFRHILIHVPQQEHSVVLKLLFHGLKPGRALLAEESDLRTWKVAPVTPEPLCSVAEQGIRTVLQIYASRSMNTGLGENLEMLLVEAGFEPINIGRRGWHVKGGTEIAKFHEQSMLQLAQSVSTDDPMAALQIRQLAACCADKQFEYEARTTVSISARKPKAT
jgi:SAM-dependent methyltransferase